MSDEKEKVDSFREGEWSQLGIEINRRREKIGLSHLAWPEFNDHDRVRTIIFKECTEALNNKEEKGTYYAEKIREMDEIVVLSILYLRQSVEEYKKYKESKKILKNISNDEEYT